MTLLSGDSTAAPAGVSMSQMAAVLRCVAALLEAASGDTVIGAPRTAKRAESEFKTAGKVSVWAETLLSVLVTHRQRVEQTEPDHAWMTRHEWFPASDIRRDRRDAESLIAELLESKFIEERRQGAKACRHQFRATVAGAEYVMRLDPDGVFRRVSTYRGAIGGARRRM